MMTVVLDHLSWPTGLAVAAICRAWCAETADVIRASAWKWQVPLPNEGSPGMLLRALYRGIGLADLVRMRTASTFERFEEGLRVAVFGAVGQWANLPPLCVSRCPAEWEKLPEETWWLARKGTGHTWRFQRFYVDIGGASPRNDAGALDARSLRGAILPPNFQAGKRVRDDCRKPCVRVDGGGGRMVRGVLRGRWSSNQRFYSPVHKASCELRDWTERMEKHGAFFSSSLPPGSVM